MSHANPHAPGALDEVQQFLNTLYADRSVDFIADPAALAAWLRERGWLSDAAVLTPSDVAATQTFREALRALAATNQGEPMPRDAAAVLDRAGARAGLAFVYEAAANALAISSRATGLDAVFARLLRIVYDAQRGGTWPRFRICGRASCRWAFYDYTKNRSGQWCEMSICGNREKARRRRTARNPAA